LHQGSETPLRLYNRAECEDTAFNHPPGQFSQRKVSRFRSQMVCRWQGQDVCWKESKSRCFKKDPRSETTPYFPSQLSLSEKHVQVTFTSNQKEKKQNKKLYFIQGKRNLLIRLAYFLFSSFSGLILS